MFYIFLYTLFYCSQVYSLKYYGSKHTKSIGITKLNAEVMSSMGSDALERPDDEDSPEFKEYLKQLLKMQANRAKGGHAAPSSGSSDAYIAKLNRLKLEKLVRFRAGLPDLPLDTSYKPEDYASAIFEATEVPVSTPGAPLSIDAATGGGGGKVRGLTADEIRMAKLAEEKVRKELEEFNRMSQSTQVSVNAAETKKSLVDMQQKPKPVKFDSEFENELVSTMLGTKAGTVIAQQPQKKNVELPKPVVKQVASTVPVQSTPVQQVISTVKNTPAVAATPKSSAPLPISISTTNTATPTVITTSSSTKTSLDKSIVNVRKLTQKELDIAGKALQLTVMHRGGGPFGAGRLKGDEALQLSEALTTAYEMLKNDAVAATPVEIKSKTQQVFVEEKLELPALSQKQLPTVQSRIAPAEPLPVVNKSAKKEVSAVTKASIPTPIPSAAQPITKPPLSTTVSTAQPIAMGLDRFLQNSKDMNIEELDALRDGLIQCLTLVQSAINVGKPMEIVNESSQIVSTSATDRMVDTYFNSEVPMIANPNTDTPSLDQTIDSNNSVGGSGGAMNERELKLALGLLLKHRGGPGFGHGRLEGNELLLMEKKLRSAADLFITEATSTTV